MRVPWRGQLLIAIASLLAGFASGRAHARQTLADLPDVANSTFNRADLDAMQRLVPQLSPEQTEAIEAELVSAMEEMGREISKSRLARWDRGRESGAGLDNEQRIRVWRAQQRVEAEETGILAVKLERRTLERIRALLTPAQIEDGWEAWQRSRRLRLMPEVFSYTGLRVETVPQVLALARLGPEDQAAAADLLDAHAIELDALLRLGIDLQRTLAAKLRAVDLPVGGEKESLPEYGRLLELSHQADKLSVRTFQRLAALLSAEGRVRLERQRAEALCGVEQFVDRTGSERGVRDINFMDRRQALTIASLTDDQRTAIRALLETARAKALDVYRQDLAEADRAVLDGGEFRRDESTAKARERSISEIGSRLRDDIRSLLTDEQNLEFQMGWRPGSSGREAFERRRRNTTLGDE